MDKSEKNITRTSEKLLETFLQGNLSEEERFELEKRALDDPFLFSALEGYSLNTGENLSDLKAIDKKIKNRLGHNKSQRRILPYWRILGIAALFLLLFSVLFLLNQYVWNPKNEILAVQSAVEFEQSDVEEALSVESSSNQAENIRDESDYNEEPEVQALKSKRSSSSINQITETKTERQISQDNAAHEHSDFAEIQAIEAMPQIVIEEELADKDQISIKDSGSGELDNNKNTQKEAMGLPYSEEPLLADEPAREGNLYIEGNVVNADGKPVKGAKVNAKNSAITAETDEAGNFRMDISDSTDEIIVSSEGYNRAQVQIDGATKMDVTLNNGANLSEIVVETSKSNNTAFPAMGFKAFEEFVDENLIKPMEAVQAGINGTVSIEFTVGPYGELSDFRILQSLGYGCDEEAIRLLKAGGNWETNPKFKNMRTIYNFTF